MSHSNAPQKGNQVDGVFGFVNPSALSLNSDVRLDDLARRRIEIAFDTESADARTLTIQTACRLQTGTIAAKVYRDKSVPGLPKGFEIRKFVPSGAKGYGRFVSHLKLRSTGTIKPCLSPARYLADLFEIERVDFLSRQEGEELLKRIDPQRGPRNCKWDKDRQRWKIPALEIVLIGHFLAADFARVFGADFLRKLLESGAVTFSDHEPLGLNESRAYPGTAPVVEYVRTRDGELFAVTLKTEDTMLPFGPASLERHSRTFLGLGKLDDLTEDDKSNMQRTFKAKTSVAYGYAIRDVVNTLLVIEQMQQQDRQLRQEFRIADDDARPMRSTVGGRVADFLFRMTQRWIGTKSSKLDGKRDLRFLMKQGGGTMFQHGPLPSVFGAQTATIHGGLNFSRSPTVFFHDAPGMLRDMDMASCYNSAMATMNVYWGRPIIHEPGRRALTLREAVERVNQQADHDAWMIRVTGEVHSLPNTLIPSTAEAMTSENYSEKMRERVLADTFDEMESLPELGGGRLYSQKIESGVVTWATWLMIQAMPTAARREYESLTADSIVYYPRDLAATNAAEYNRLVEQNHTGQLPWETEVDMKKRKIVKTIHIEDSYVSLRYPIGQLAAQIARIRRKVKLAHGRKSGQDAAIKLLANSMYGVIGSRFYDTGNVVAANVITARVRAEAWAMMLALNGIQLITDGCTYRADQVPACSFEECLRIQPDFPLRRAEADSGIPFVGPATIPTESRAFSKWCRQHVKRFFGVSGEQYDSLFGTHDLEHRPTSETATITFDGLACDGGSNYVKCMQAPDGSWRAEDFKARSYGQRSKQLIAPWLIATYSEDQLLALAPIAEEDDLLSFDAAVRKAQAALKDESDLVCFPLGYPATKVLNYKAIRPASWIYKTPKQRKTILKQVEKFEKEHECGLEILALRRSYDGHKKGSLQGLAEALYLCVQADSRDLTKRFNLNRPFDALDKVAHPRRLEIQRHRARAKERLAHTMDFTQVDASRSPTGMVLTKNDLHLLATR